MAITRAQQFRQMLEDGGMLVSPSTTGKRPGYRRSKYDSSGGGTASSEKSKDRSPGPGDRDDVREQYSVRQTQTGDTPGRATTSSRRPNYTPGGGLEDSKKPSDSGRRQRAAFLAANPPATLTALRQRGVGGVPFGVPGSSFFNLTRRFRDYTLGKNIDYFSDLKNRALDDEEERGIDFYERSADGYKEYMKDRLAGKIDAAGNLKAGFMRDGAGNIISTGNDGRDLEAEQQALIAQAVNPTQATTPTSAIDPIFYRLAADGGMIEDAPVGGIMDLESGRQMYFLGKLVKKATRAVKKIVKSPLGKAAILGGAAYFGGGGASGLKKFFGAGSFNPLKTISTVTGLAGPRERAGLSGLGKILNKLGLADFKGGLTDGGMAALIGGGVTSIPLIASLFGINGKEDDNTIDPSLLGPTIDIAGVYNNPFGTQYRRIAADGGRIGYSEGSKDVPTFREFVRNSFLDSGQRPKDLEDLDIKRITLFSQAYQDKYGEKKADGGRIEYQEGSKEPVAKKTMPLLDMDGQEMDLRDNGGFVPIGRMEKADDVPARLSKNEFVFTADAVRNAGDGDVDKGAEVMYNMMKNLEDGGNVSEESQGLEGARNMFQTAQRLEEVL